jgi:hypothetical protein
MNTLDRLKILYAERYLEHLDIDLWNEAIEREWTKIVAVVEAANRVVKSDIVRAAYFASYSEALFDLGEALATLTGQKAIWP